MATPKYKHDKTSVMGHNAFCVGSRDAGEGVHVEFWSSKDQMDVFIVRIVDTDSDSLVGLTKFEGNDSAHLADKYYRSV